MVMANTHAPEWLWMLAVSTRDRSVILSLLKGVRCLRGLLVAGASFFGPASVFLGAVCSPLHFAEHTNIIQLKRKPYLLLVCSHNDFCLLPSHQI